MLTVRADDREKSATTVIESNGDVVRPNAIRDGLAGALLVLGLLLPWNIESGVSISGSAGWLTGLMILVSLPALVALVLDRLHRRDEQAGRRSRLKLLLSTPYLLVAAGFVAFTIVQSIRYGGSGSVPPGVGPGIWLGTAGALLAAQPSITPAAEAGQWPVGRVARIIGLVSLVLASAATLFNLYWRTRFVLPHIGDAGIGVQNLVVAVAAVLYGAAALVPVVIAARWLMSDEQTTRLATVLLGAATLVGGALVWLLPVGRDLDAFHGIAQNASTAGVGFEGYLAWSAGGALVGTVAVLGLRPAKSVEVWRGAARKCLLLIAVWGASSAALRIVDLVSVAVLDLPALPYSSTALMAFDLVVAVLAMWLFVNHRSGSESPRSVVTLLFGILFVLTVSRVILGVALVPRGQPLNASDINDVYGNTLSQQIVGTFDVVLCLLALAVFAIPFCAGIRSNRLATVRATTDFVTVDALTDGETGTERTAVSGEPSAPETVRIARPQNASAAPGSAHDRVASVLAESTRRFAAGTTYGEGGGDT